MKYSIRPILLALILGGISTYLALQSLLVEFLLEIVLSEGVDSFVIQLLDLFSVNVEESIPTWFATLLLFLGAVFLVSVWGVKRRKGDAWRYYWLGLALLFLYLSVDEGAGIHEISADPLQTFFQTGGYLAFGWQILYLPLTLIFAICYIPFLSHLPRRSAMLFVLSGGIYVGGAVFIEGISANRWYLDGGVSFAYLSIATLEEWMEMMGATLFIYTLSDYIVEQRYVIAVDFLPDPPLVSHRLADRISWPRLGLVVTVLLLMNVGLFFLVSGVGQTALAVDRLPYHERLIAMYPEHQIILLQYGGEIDAKRAESFVHLFDDVLVIYHQTQNSSVVFASSNLPFTQEDVINLLPADELNEFSLLTQSDLIAKIDLD